MHVIFESFFPWCAAKPQTNNVARLGYKISRQEVSPIRVEYRFTVYFSNCYQSASRQNSFAAFAVITGFLSWLS